MQKVLSVSFFLSPGGENVLFFSLNGVFPLYRYTIIKESSMKTTTLPTHQLLMVNSESSCYIFEHHDNLGLS